MARFLQLFALVFFGLTLIFQAWAQSLDLPTQHIDGAFQTASGLFRLTNGEFPGRDFFPYLGAGPLYLLYPGFLAAGSDLASSVMIAQLFTYFAAWAALFTITFLIAFPKRILLSALFSAFCYLGILHLSSQGAGHYILDVLVNPGMSLRFIRAFLPYLTAIALYLVLRVNAKNKVKSIMSGSAVALSLIWSNDYAYTTSIAFSLCFTLAVLRSFNDSRLANLCIFAATFIILGALFLTLSTAGHPIDYLLYGFRDVAVDQWWYFGPYETTSRIFGLGDIGKVMSTEVLLSIAVLAIVFAIWIADGRQEILLVFGIGLATFASGLIASVGGHIWGYFEVFKFWAATTGASLVVFSIRNHTSLKTLRILPNWIASSAFIIALALLIHSALQSYLDLKALEKHIAANSDKIYVPELGGYLSKDWQPYLAFARENMDVPVIEEYWGIFSAINSADPVWPVDSVIHALGQTRRITASSIENAEIVVTSKFEFSPTWQPWSVSQNFWFYDKLFSLWEPVLLSPNTIVWAKADKPPAPVDAGCEVTADGQGFLIANEKDEFFRVKIGFEIYNPENSRLLFMVRNNISFASAARGYLSVDPARTEATFPVLRYLAGEPLFDLQLIGNQTAFASIDWCEASVLPNPGAGVLHKGSPDTFYLTDDNWDMGVARNWAGFFLPDLDQFISQFRPGRNVEFGNGDVRRITQVIRESGYLNVYLEGEPLSADEVGVPSGFTVRK
ncbi:hypothetical protein EI983_15710 [Roseovarius faecimaris]|uniref:Uncharacterized protein n=1 Tax=Roseovarius faecimaris TaxID=2494550 RepID=A0A6I6IUR5_9RHOB|nr:hypothetical protein [Roseovarius faecimaris]QGX99633.1 hypothetical protein EI983_15710 [Roseovarius faecimaris]